MNSQAKFYITTSIPYANAKPHLGHAMEFVQADTLARWHRQRGEDVLLQIGTDEHGQKLYEAAQQAGIEPLTFVNEMSESFIKIAKDLQVNYDQFVRTTDAHHKEAAQKLWQACEKDIYKGTYTGLYCVACERYYTEKDSVEGFCPIHPNRMLEELSLESYFLKLEPYQLRLIKALEGAEYNVFPEFRRNEILSFLRSNKLEDLSISRPKNQLEWGVEVPGDDSHVMYVWFDALANYITSLGYPDGADFQKWWPADLHIVGKDINRFHSVYWPIMLMSAGVALPKALYVHGFINAPGGLKMSKSLGNVIEPYDIIDKYGVDAFRYYLLRYIPHDADGEFGAERFHATYTSDLVNNLGNLVQRVASMTVRYCEGQYEPGTEVAMPQESPLQHAAFDHELQNIWKVLDDLNESIEQSQPWQLVKSDPATTRKLLTQWIHEIVRVSFQLQPFLPETATKIQRTFADGKVDTEIGILFPRLEES